MKKFDIEEINSIIDNFIAYYKTKGFYDTSCKLAFEVFISYLKGVNDREEIKFENNLNKNTNDNIIKIFF